MSILFPPDLASQLVLTFLAGAVLYWVLTLGRTWVRVRRERKAVDRLSRPEAVEAMREYRQSAGPGGSTEDFLDYVGEQVPVSSSRVTAEHVTSILEAGLSGARLEVRQRLSSTAGRIFQKNSQLKAVLSVFIVIGLLGTLYGLAEALGTLSANDLLNFSPSVVGTLLGRLKTALAPSIWGVLVTVIGVLIYGYYINAVCQPVKMDLEQATLEHWVPALYPTESQQAKETLEEAHQQLEENVEAAERVAQFAERVDGDLQNFDKRIRSAGELLSRVESSLEDLAGTSESFQEAMAGVENFQDQLASTLGRIESGQKSVASLLEKLESRDEAFDERLGDLRELKEAWQSHLVKTQKQLQSVTEATQSALTRLEERNEEMVEEVAEPVAERLEALTSQLSNVDESMHSGLQDVEGSLNRLRDPVEGSAERIERIADTFSESLQSAVSGVRGEFERQNDVQKGKKDELARLNDNLESLIEKQDAVHRAIRESELSANGTGMLSRIRNYFRD
jgi:chromosome segregation ATPase